MLTKWLAKVLRCVRQNYLVSLPHNRFITLAWIPINYSLFHFLQCHLNFPDFMDLGSFIFFQFYNNVLCWVCDSSHLLLCKQLHSGSKQGRNSPFCPQNQRETKPTAPQNLPVKWNTFNSPSLPLLFLTWLYTGFINLLWILDSPVVSPSSSMKELWLTLLSSCWRWLSASLRPAPWI